MAQTKTTKKKTTTKEIKKTKTPKVTETKKTKKVTKSPRKTASEKLEIRKSHNFILILAILGLLCMYISNILGIIITLAAFALSVVELKSSTLKITIAFIISAIASIVFVVTYDATLDDKIVDNTNTTSTTICETEEKLYEETASTLVDSNLVFNDSKTTITKNDLDSYLEEKLNNDCDGYIEVTKDENDNVVYEAYVKCTEKNYTCQTEGYTEE